MYQELKDKQEKNLSELMTRQGVFWAFSKEQLNEGIKKLKERGQLKEGEKLTAIEGGGGFTLKKC